MKKCVWIILCFLVANLGLSQETDHRYQAMEDAFNQGYELLFTNKDSSYLYFDRALDLADAMGDYQSQLDILGYLTYANGYHFDLKNHRQNLLKTSEILAIDSLQNTIEDYDTYVKNHLLDTGNYFFKTKEYGRAKQPFIDLQTSLTERPIEEINKDDAAMLFSVYNFLATIYKHEGKYELSEQYYLQNKNLAKTNKGLQPNEQSYLTNINQLLAQLYLRTGQYQKGNQLLADALKRYKSDYQSDEKFKNTLITVYQKITENYLQQDSLAKALYYINESAAYLLEGDPFYKHSLVLYGDIYARLGEDDKALDKYREALAFFKDYRQHKSHQDVAEVQGKIADFFLKQGTYKEGLQWLTKALQSAGPKIKLTDLAANPDPNEVFSKRQLLQLLDLKIRLLRLAHIQTDEDVYLNAAIATNRTILQTFELLKIEFDSKLDKQFLAETAYPIFHRMLALTHTAYQKNSSPELFDLALNISEKNKDFLLLEALRNANATKYGDIPKVISDKESRFRAEITHLEKKNFDATEEDLEFSEELFMRKQAYYNFLDTLKIEYPKYHTLKYQNKVLDLISIRNALENDEVLISYTMVDGHLFVQVIDSKRQEFLKIPFSDSDRATVRQFYKLLSIPSLTDNTTAIHKLAKQLFDTVLDSALANSNSTNLTIVPDGELHYLPFDLLQKNETYLLKNKSIGYGNSITSLLELKKKKTANKNQILAFAPSFKDAVAISSDRQFGKLLYNDDEVGKLASYFDCEIVLDENATLSNFRKRAPNFNVLHLATHASANDEYPDYSYIAFSDESQTEEENILYVKDLYNTSLDVDMITLSACQTGIGKLQKGQGMLSLSKGFYYAGAKSLVNTLWKINDKSSVKLMEYFYENLSEGQSKKEAMRSAKLKYLETTEDELLKHPYYWSAFVVSGNMAPLDKPVSYWFWSFLLIPIVIIAGMKAKKRRSI